MVGKLEEMCRAEFDSVMEDRAVVAKLNELETLVSEAGSRRGESGGGEEWVLLQYLCLLV